MPSDRLSDDQDRLRAKPYGDGPLIESRPTQGRTLLPGPVASTVSAVTGATALGWKVTSKVGGWWITAAREATLTSLEITRLATEAVLTTVGRDVSRRTSTELGRAEAEGILERTVSAFHSTISTVSIFAASGFYATSAGLDSVSALSIHGLATLNAILGSTETSRAVAAIITLIRDEFKRGDPNGDGNPMGYFDLVIGTIGFVLLQRWGRRKTELDFRESGGEETIWDTVIDDKGFRAEVVATRSAHINHPILRQPAGAHAFMSPGGDEEIEALERGTLHDTASIQLSSDDQTKLSDEEIRDEIMRQLPEGARAVITSETITAKTIKVDIYDSDTMHIEAPPGTVMIAERLNPRHSGSHSPSDGLPQQTVVFRTAHKRSSSTEVNALEELRMTSGPVSQEEYEDEDVVMITAPMEVPTDKGHLSKRLRKHDTRMNSPRTSSSPDEHPPAPIANQKKSRKPVILGQKVQPAPESSPNTRSQTRAAKDRSEANAKPDKSGPLKKALKSLSPSSSSTAIKDHVASGSHTGKRSGVNQPSAGAVARMSSISNKPPSLKPLPPRPVSRTDMTIPGRLSPHDSRIPSNQTYFAVHESRRDSTVSQTDTYSLHSVESRPGSPTFSRMHVRTSSGLTKTKSDLHMDTWNANPEQDQPPQKHHQRSKSFVPSLYSMTTGKSDENIILVPKSPMPRRSIYDDHEILTALTSSGMVPGIFPRDQHLVRIVRRFARFSSASYGSNFLRVMGLSSPETTLSKSTEIMALDVHHEHNSFSNHTGLPAETILLSSYYDPRGVSGNTEWSPSAISPLIHFISIDRESKAVVLTCRGTLGFEDVLTDMTCDYDEVYWQGQTYNVHKGVHASARRLLGGSGSRVMATIKESLEEFPDFGLVLCGHSLGGAVAALLAILISEPAKEEKSGTAFVTARRPTKYLTNSSSSSHDAPVPISLPPGRPIHVYAYGPPATFSEDLRVATRGLITTTVNHADIVPSLSLGMLHDFRAVAANLKTDTTNRAIENLKSRVVNRLVNALKSAFYVDQPPPVDNLAGDGLGEDTWAWTALTELRTTAMTNHKLVPPGEVFVVETTRVFDRQQHYSAFAAGDTATERVYRSLGRPATRVQFKFIRDVVERFGELRFGRSMFSDHSPGRYEANLAALERGILES